MTARFFVLARRPVDAEEFVAFWEARYQYPNTDVYDRNVGEPLNPERVRTLYLWKNGGRLSAAARQTIEVNFVRRIKETTSLPKDTAPKDFLRRFSKGGAIWRIFWLHLWQPHRYPIYDQHVHRAMRLIETGRAQEISTSGPSKIRSYLDEYIPFIEARFAALDPRRIDKALWAFGRTMKWAATLPSERR